MTEGMDGSKESADRVVEILTVANYVRPFEPEVDVGLTKAQVDEVLAFVAAARKRLPSRTVLVKSREAKTKYHESRRANRAGERKSAGD